MKKFFSIIMPVYNSSQYLSYALRSVLQQSYSNFELLLINDGSKDNSVDICREFSKKDDRIIFIDKKNEGVAISRNRCLDIAQGEYILFVDSDDILYGNALENIYLTLSTLRPDMLRFEYQYIDEKGDELYPNYEKIRRKKEQKNVMDSPSFMERIMYSEYFLCVNCYKRLIISQSNLRFKEGCTFNEDTLFICQFLTHSKRNVYISDKVYGYRKTKNAVTMNFTERNANDILGVFHDLNLMANSCDLNLKRSVKRVSQYLLLNLYEHCSMFSDERFSQALAICLKEPLLLEWKLFVIFQRKAEVLWRVINLKRKITRRINYYLNSRN